MHDRRINGEVLRLGNQGALYMNSMTWWDRETESVWSQPWGTAIAGPLKGTALTLIPASVVPWETWRSGHPDTSVLANDLKGIIVRRAVRPSDDFVIGVALEDGATAYRYEKAAEERVINDVIAENPVVVFVDPDTRDIKVYLRRVNTNLPDGRRISELTFELEGMRIVDSETGSRWDSANGLALEGPLKGTLLQKIPYVSAFDWAWQDFYPGSPIYGDPPDYGLRIFRD